MKRKKTFSVELYLDGEFADVVLTTDDGRKARHVATKYNETHCKVGEQPMDYMIVETI
jgi:hypothetical protein